MAAKGEAATFPITDKKAGLRIDASFAEPTTYRVYYWCERPDAAVRVDGDKEHWHPDSEHKTLEAAQKRMAELKAGGKRKSILDPTEHKPGEPIPVTIFH